MSTTIDQAAMNSRVGSFFELRNQYDGVLQDLTPHLKGTPTASPPKVVDKLDNRANLEYIIKDTKGTADRLSIAGMIGSTLTPMGAEKWRVLSEFKDNLARHLKRDVERQMAEYILTGPSMDYQDRRLTENLMVSFLRNSTTAYCQKAEFKNMWDKSRSEWTDACHQRPVRDIAKLREQDRPNEYSFKPDTETHVEVWTIDLTPRGSPETWKHAIAVDRANAARVKQRLSTANANNASSSENLEHTTETAGDMEFRRARYLEGKRPVVERVVQDQSHLSDEEWEVQADYLPVLYPMSLKDGGVSLDRNDTDSTFVSLVKPLSISFWASKTGPPANSTCFAGAETLDNNLKSIGIDTQPSQSHQSEWVV